MIRLYRDYLEYARTKKSWPRLWSIGEVLWDYCPTCFHHYYSYLQWRGKVPRRSTP